MACPRDDPSLAKAAADEVLRFEPAGPFTVRIVREEFTYRDRWRSRDATESC